MKAYGQHRIWGKPLTCLIFAVAFAGGTCLIPADGGAQSLPAHDAKMTTEHNSHNTTNTTQHNSLSGQVTAHDSAQTSQHSGLPPAWDKTLPANDPGGACPNNSSRFTCVMGGAAVRDNETGLVWEKSPNTVILTWFDAISICEQREVGGRKGWHLPMLEQLASLVDSSNTNPQLPTGHPFNLWSPPTLNYWSATTAVASPTNAGTVGFANGDVGGGNKAFTSPVLAWCVRGGQSFDGNTHSTLH